LFCPIRAPCIMKALTRISHKDSAVHMNSKHTEGSSRTDGSMPTRVILFCVGVVCLALMISAFFGFTTLLRMHTLYLSNRGTEIARSIESEARGGGRRNNPEFWKTLLEEKYETYRDVAAFLALVDQDNRTLAFAGDPSFASGDWDALSNGDIYNFEEKVGRIRGPRRDENSPVSEWKIRVGLYASEADFIRNQAWILLGVSGAAIAALVMVSLYLIRTLNRFLQLKKRESSEEHLKSLGIMAASLAHEIRNPLGSMKGLTQLVQEDLARDHHAQKNLSTVVSEAERLERLVSDLLDFARPKEPQISAFSLNDLIADIGSMLEPRFVASRISFQCDLDGGPKTVRSDAAGIRQVLLNLLMNALDATPEGGTVFLKTVRDASDGAVTIQVDDTGPGLGERNAEDLFEPFVTTGTRGTGLGLTISRGIIESLDGTLTLADNSQGGMRCTIRLNRAAVADMEPN
jgi:signal transduction histidine kinase